MREEGRIRYWERVEGEEKCMGTREGRKQKANKRWKGRNKRAKQGRKRMKDRRKLLKEGRMESWKKYFRKCNKEKNERKNGRRMEKM